MVLRYQTLYLEIFEISFVLFKTDALICTKRIWRAPIDDSHPGYRQYRGSHTHDEGRSYCNTVLYGVMANLYNCFCVMGFVTPCVRTARAVDIGAFTSVAPRRQHHQSSQESNQE
jgi:hypothetical protein